MPGRQMQAVDLNHADFEQLIQIEGIDRKRAELILTYRREHGPFHNWDELRNVPGIGDSLVDRAREAGTLGGGGTGEQDAFSKGQPAESRPQGEAGEGPEAKAEEKGEEDEEEQEEEDEEEEVDPDEMEALLSLAQLDSEAATAYAIAAESVSSRELQGMLRAFGGDHRRHVEDIQRFAHDSGVKAEIGSDGSSLVSIARAMGVLDPQAALEGIIGNELLTNAIYETALWVVSDDEALEIVRRNREDEARHLQALQSWAAEHEEDED